MRSGKETAGGTETRAAIKGKIHMPPDYTRVGGVV